METVGWRTNRKFQIGSRGTLLPGAVLPFTQRGYFDIPAPDAGKVRQAPRGAQPGPRCLFRATLEHRPTSARAVSVARRKSHPTALFVSAKGVVLRKVIA